MSEERPVAIVSGGSRGLGGALVEHLLERGWRVATFSRTEPGLVAHGAEALERYLWERLDLSEPTAVSGFVQGVQQRWGRIDALVNNAAIANDGVLALTSEADIHRMIAVNLEGALWLTRAVIRVMLQGTGDGCIINVSSIVGTRGATGLAVYSATKAALDGLTRSLARELGPRGIRVNSVAPGYLETELSSTLGPPQRAQIERRTPLGRLGTVRDVTGVVEFLLSKEAGFVTGQTLVVDGGLTC